MQCFGLWLPVVESSRQANSFGCWMSELKANGHKLQAGVQDIVVVVIVFHSWRFIGMVDFCLFEKCSISFSHHAPNNLPWIWGVTLPMINGSSPDKQAGMNKEIGRGVSAGHQRSLRADTGAGANMVCASQRKMEFHH